MAHAHLLIADLMYHVAHMSPPHRPRLMQYGVLDNSLYGDWPDRRSIESRA